jgi:hypothetical protein
MFARGKMTRASKVMGPAASVGSGNGWGYKLPLRGQSVNTQHKQQISGVQQSKAAVMGTLCCPVTAKKQRWHLKYIPIADRNKERMRMSSNYYFYNKALFITETIRLQLQRWNYRAVYTRKDQIRNTGIREEPNILNLNNTILNSRSQWKNHFIRLEDRRIPKKGLTYNTIRRRNIARQS